MYVQQQHPMKIITVECTSWLVSFIVLFQTITHADLMAISPDQFTNDLYHAVSALLLIFLKGVGATLSSLVSRWLILKASKLKIKYSIKRKPRE